MNHSPTIASADGYHGSYANYGDGSLPENGGHIFLVLLGIILCCFGIKAIVSLLPSDLDS
jgi:hypothetical protein